MSKIGAILPGTVGTSAAAPAARSMPSTSFQARLQGSQAAPSPMQKDLESVGRKTLGLPTDRVPTPEEIRAAMREAVLSQGLTMGSQIAMMAGPRVASYD